MIGAATNRRQIAGEAALTETVPSDSCSLPTVVLSQAANRSRSGVLCVTHAVGPGESRLSVAIG